MAVLESGVDPRSSAFAANDAAMRAAIDEFRGIERRVADAAEARAPRYRARGLLSPRERLGLLLDPGAPFLELSTLCGYQQEGDVDGSAAGGGCIAGIGCVAGVRCMALVDDYLTKGGSITELGSVKRQRMMEIAFENKLPLVALSQSGGGNLTQLGDWFAFSGRAFARQARMSAAGVPQVTVVHGSATAGGAYQPGLSDYVVMVRRQSTVYLAGPPLLKAATGEVADEESIGGAEMHAGVAGTADYLAEDDRDGIRIAREIVGSLGWPEAESPRDAPAPKHGAEELPGIVPVDPKTAYDSREIIARVADASEFLDFKPDYDAGTVCGHASILGWPCGIVANNAPITAAGAAKAGQFVQLCEQSRTPLLFLHNTTGFLVGTAAEQAGIIKHGAKLIQAVVNSVVTKISVVVGGSYGAGNYAMCGRGIDPDFMFAWPRTVVSVMGPAQAGMVLRTVAEARMHRSGEVDEAALERLERETVDAMTAKSHALANTARVWDDGMIDPRDTRAVVGFVLGLRAAAERIVPRPNTFGVARL